MSRLDLGAPCAWFMVINTQFETLFCNTLCDCRVNVTYIVVGELRIIEDDPEQISTNLVWVVTQGGLSINYLSISISAC